MCRSVRVRVFSQQTVTCVSLILSVLLNVNHAMDSPQCYDWQGNAVADGEKYVPNKEDPCMTCTCDNGFRIMCKSVACSPPGNCALWELIDGVCCEYICKESGLGNNVQGGTNFNGSHPDHDGGTVTDDNITNLGLRLVASTVTSFLVLALLLFMVHRLRQRRLLLAMRRFEAQARRQQLEETDSDHYIPETFLGIECPPYEDPPPAYSSPKPPPRIIPGDAPPPYEEIDQNPLCPLNNNEINRVITEENNAPTPRQCSTVPNSHNFTEVDNLRVETAASPNVESRIENEEMRRNQNVSDTVMRGVCVLPDFNGKMHSFVDENINFIARQIRRDGLNNDPIFSASRSGEVPLLSSSVRSESHNCTGCSCDEDQTMLKSCYSAQMCSHESPLLETNLASTSQPYEQYSHGLPHQSHSTLSVSMTEHSDPRKLIRQFDRFASLPRQVRPSEDQRFSNPETVMEFGETEQGIPLVDMRKTVCEGQTDMSDGTTSSKGRLILRTAADGASRQDLLRSSVLPLTLNDKVTPLCSNIMVPNHGQASIQSSEARLRNLRLSNLTNSPTKQLDSLSSPVTPEEQQMRRTQSVTSEVSIFSICSETGELKIPKTNGHSLRNDSQYPDTNIRPQLLRKLVNSVETSLATKHEEIPVISQKQPGAQREISNNYKGTEDEISALIAESQCDTICDVGGPIGATALIQNFNKLNMELKEKSKTKEKPKGNRHSTGCLPPQKQKKGRHVSMEAGPSVSNEAKPCETSNKKHENGHRKGAKHNGFLKQYGFIDKSANSENSNSLNFDCLKGSYRIRGDFKDIRNGSTNHRTKPEPPVGCDLPVLQSNTEHVPGKNEKQNSLKPGVKWQLHYSGKNPSRQKSRPMSLFPSHKEMETDTWNNLSKESKPSCVSRRKSKPTSISRNKKRQSYPVSNIQNVENTGIVLSPNIVGCVSDLTNETVPPVSNSHVNHNTTLLNGYVYKYNTDDKTQENPNIYVKVRPTSLSSYV